MKIWQADLLIILAGIIWGVSYIFSRWGLADCSPALYLFLRFLVASLAAWLLLRRSLKKTTPKIRKEGLTLGLMMGGGYLLQVYSINFTEVARAAFLTSMCLLAIPILSFILFREVIRAHSLFGVVTAVIGLYIFLDPNFAGINAGDILVILAIPMWALYMIYVSVYTRSHEDSDTTYQYLFWQLVGVMPLALIAALIFETGLVPPLHPDLGKGLALTPKLVIGVVFNGLLATLLTVFLQTKSQKFTTAVQAMICFQVEPVVATISAVFILSEAVNANIVVGGFIIIMAVFLSELGGIISERKKVKA
jgi:drug/metabolite transporter (DMT)-like permease